MSKPAPGTPLDPANPLYTSLVAAWCFSEGSGSSSADCAAGHDLTLSAGVAWTTNGASEPILTFDGTATTPTSFTPQLHFLKTESWSVAWRGKTAAASGSKGMLFGAVGGGNDFAWMNPAAGTISIRDHVNNTATFAVSAANQAVTADYLVVRNTATTSISLYRNGSLIGTDGTWDSTRGEFYFSNIGNGYIGSAYSLAGTLEYVYPWQGRALTSADAVTLATTPYGIFTGGGGGGGNPPATPTVTAGSITTTGVTLTGSAFSDPDSDTHAASQWQVATSADTGYSSPVISTGDDATHLTSYAATGLAPGTAYRARVRYKDSTGSYSAYSSDATFTTTAAANSIAITSPVAYQFKWRGASGSATHTITGTYTGTPGGAIEVSTDGSTWATLVASPTGGAYTGTVTLATGTYTIAVRWVSDHAVTASVANVSTAYVIGISGQSNSTGRGSNLQTLFMPTGVVASLKTSSSYAVLADPYSSDGGAAGSFVIPMITALAQVLKAPIGVVPCGVGGSSIISWIPTHTNYANMIPRLNSVGGCDVLVWWQGETDAMSIMEIGRAHV